jgi:hypothetical protein
MASTEMGTASPPFGRRSGFLDLMTGFEYDVFGSCKVGDGTNYLSQQSV